MSSLPSIVSIDGFIAALRGRSVDRSLDGKLWLPLRDRSAFRRQGAVLAARLAGEWKLAHATPRLGCRQVLEKVIARHLRNSASDNKLSVTHGALARACHRSL